MRALVLMLLIFATSALAGIDGLNPDLTLNRSKISKAYFEGDFDMVVNALETFRKVQPNPTREDRIYAYKYLSVIYAATPETRAKAESFMYQLLKLMPSIELMDLYISDNIEAIFNSVRIRYEQQQRIGLDSGQGGRSPASAKTSATAVPKSAFPEPAPVQPARPAKPVKPAKSAKVSEGGSAWAWWTAGAVGLAAAVAGYVYLNQPAKSEPPPAKKPPVEL